jgi:prolyl-tRNA editing enzyme YbaK/EbsC (Cys-tRNA(Pro) deacylase)
MKADRYLKEQGINFEEVIQDSPTKRCDEAARERGVETSQIVKSLIVESEGEKFHISIPGDRTLSESKFGSEYRMVPPEESEKLTGFESGTVHPFSTELKHFVDERVFENEKVSHTVGEEKRGLIIESGKFREALEKSDFEFEVRDIVVSGEEDFQELEEIGLNREDSKFVVNNGYRKLFKDLNAENGAEEVFNLLKAVHREKLELNPEVSQEILNRSEGQTHTQKLVEEISRNGELPEEEEFDLEGEISELLEENPEAVKDLRNGKDSTINYLIGELMQKTNGQAEPGKARVKIINKAKEKDDGDF